MVLGRCCRWLDSSVSDTPELSNANLAAGLVASFARYFAYFALAIISISLPYKGNPNDQYKYILHLRRLFNEPLFLTNKNTTPLYANQDRSRLRIFGISQLENLAKERNRVYAYRGGQMEPWDTAMVMLTSGSTGVSKAVDIKHQQIFASIRAKSTMLYVVPQFSCEANTDNS